MSTIMQNKMLFQKLGLRTVVLALILLAIVPRGQAGHLSGAYITYECINACTTRVFTRKYHPCICVYGIFPYASWKAITPGCPLPQPITPLSSQIVTEITPICNAIMSQCNTPGAPINGSLEYFWYRDFDVCVGQACEYNLGWGECCRAPMVQSIVSPGNQGTFLTDTYFNNSLTTCNNSARLLDGPLRFLAAGQDHDLSLHAYDIDGDSLAYVLGPCHADSLNTVNYQQGFSGLQPLGPSWGVSLDPNTGILHLVANPGNPIYAVICVVVREYRNGQLVGSTTMDFDIEIFNSNNLAPTLDPISNITGVSGASGDDLFLCAPGPFCFEIGSADGDVGQNLKLYWDRALPGAQFVSTLNATITDTITGTSAAPPRGKFCWTPPGFGIYQVKFRVKDDACPLWWHADRVVTIHVGPSVGSSTAFATLGPCPFNSFSASFSASGCGPGPFTYAWSGAGGLTGSTQSVNHTYAAPGSYPWQVVVRDGALVNDTIRDTLVVLGQIPYQSLITGNAGLDSCAGLLTNTLGAGAYINYSWSNGSLAPLITVTMPGFYSVTVQDPSGCFIQDSTTVGWNPVDITGQVRTSLGTYLQNQKIYLIRRDTALQALYATDSTITDVFGYYQFCNVTDTIVLLKAAPDSLAYPNEMPTYANLTLVSNNAVNFYPLVQTPFSHNFATVFGSNPGGLGFIGGLISQGANKMSAVGDPIIGLRVALVDHLSHAIIGTTVTNINGYFSFAGIPISSYDIVPDRPMVSHTNVPLVVLTAQQAVRDSLDFQLHRYWLELVNTSVSAAVPMPGMQFDASPNPFSKTTRINLQLPTDADVTLDVYDVVGKRVAHLVDGPLSADGYAYQVGEGMQNGIYFVRLRVNDEVRVLKVLKQD